MSQSTHEPELSLPEMLRVMDAARALRKERETVDRAFSRDEERAFLRRRLAETAQVTGETIGEDEIEAAIDQYYSNLHAFKPAPPGLATWLAHLWVLRRTILVLGSILMGSVLLLWWLFVSESGPFSGTGQLNRNLTNAMEAIESRAASIRAVAEDQDILAEVERMKRQAFQSLDSKDLSALKVLQERIETLDRQLGENYEVRIVGNDGRQSAFEGVMTDDSGSRAAGYFVIVEAIETNGRVLPLTIHDSESGQNKSVSIWAERVPQAIYERLKTDKQSDGILDETLFAVKHRGKREWEVRLQGKDGRPIERGIQMTDWKN